MKVNEENYVVLRRAEDLLGIDYEINITNDDECKGNIDAENLIEMIDDLCSEIDRLQEKNDDLKEYYENQIKDYYKPISKYTLYGINEEVFH